MNRFLMLLGVAAVAGAMYAAAALGGQTATPTAKQFAALKTQVSTLQKELTTVKQQASDADGFVQNCLLAAGIAPVSQFGDVNATYGFQYTPSAGAPPVYRTGLDLDSSSTPQGYLQVVDATCVSASGGAAHQAATQNRLALHVERAP